jgi:hypothetical protein
VPPEIDPRSEAALVEALEDYHQRTALGEAVPLGLYQEQLGAHFPDFQAVVRAEQALDQAMAPPHEPAAEALPRTFGPFTLVRELGRGGVGVVYEAVDRRLGRTLAVKVLKVSFDTDDVALERFRREASACARVRHDHIVPIFESGEIDGQPYYAMDLVPGETLSDQIRDGRTPAPRDLCRALASVADALQALHAEGVIHRDVKPQNVMVRPDGRMVLTDFGLARTEGAGTLTQTGQALGTPLYMSPEQVHGDKRIAATTDVYGLGAVLYEALTGHPPFPMTEYPHLLYNILTVRPEPPRAVNPAVPEACERIALKALEKEPRDRYPTVSAMAADLRAFADERPVLGRPVSHPARAWRWVQRRRLPIGIAALALVALGWWWTHRPAGLSIERGAPADLEVSIDDATGVRLPVDVFLPAGEHRLVLRRPLFVAYERTLKLDAGARVLLPFLALRPDPGLKDAQDREIAAQLLARDLGLALLGPEVPVFASGTRAPTAEPPALRILAPRGLVRAEDLNQWWLELDSEVFVSGGMFELRAGEHMLWSMELSPNLVRGQRWVCGSIPRHAVPTLRPGMFLSLRWTPPPGRKIQPVFADLQIVGVVGTASALDEVDAKLALMGGAWSSLFRADVLRRAGLTTGALLETRAAIDADPADRRAWGALLRLLQDDPDLSDLELADHLRDWLRGARATAPTLCPSID